MRIAVHPRLVEEAVFHALRAAEARGDPAPGRWLRRRLERGYLLPEGPPRDLRFERAHAVAFRRLGLSRALRDLLAAHPSLARAAGPVRVGPAPGRAKEGVDLHERREAGGGAVRSVLVSVLPATLADPAALGARLHRDAAKVAAMLDPAFGWRAEVPERTPGRRETVRIRYGAAWDAWADGGLERRGLPVPVPRDRAEQDFAEVLAPLLGSEGASEAFRAIRGTDALTHDDLLRFARDPSALPGRTAPTRTPSDDHRGPAAGSPCPFCRFPTHDWAEEAGILAEGMAEALRGALPGWTPDQGICGQCLLLYRARTLIQVKVSA